MQASAIALRFVVLGPAAWSGAAKTENVVLVTLDGVRAQEVFAGMDLDVLLSCDRSEVRERVVELCRRYWAPTPRERRLRLLPFFWGTLMAEHGSIGGNRALGSVARVQNRHRFSYPGYSEILTGLARDDDIKSNDKVQNLTPTVLEFLKEELALDRRQVASFASWEVMRWIAEHRPGSITANAGVEAYEHPDPVARELSRLQFQARPPWAGVRHDAFTARFALAHVAAWRPRVLHVGLDETDDWSHERRYDRVLEALEETDAFLRELWTFLQSAEQYRGKTTLLLTTDHGRGDTPRDWSDHGEKVEGAQYIWIAVAGPDSPLRGEWTGGEAVLQSQIAATLCRFLGLDYLRAQPQAGKSIARLFADGGSP